MFSTKGLKRKVSQYLSYGSGQVLKIYEIEIRSFAQGACRVNFKMESKPVEGLTPVEGHEGRIGTVTATSYINNEKDQRKFVTEVIAPIAIEMGVKAEVDEIVSGNFKDYMAAVQPILLGKFCRWFIAAKEYLSSDGQGRIKYNLILPRYNFVESLDRDTRMADFDKENKYHYKKVEVPPAPAPEARVETFEPEADETEGDLPF